ncbi:MAG: nitrate reductase subunit beta [Flaviflexus sp.]|uniref:nitrate reductase subunit beta n=1 Tax=Flaviflexus sp. TaxID=1969482 RepID=UPI003F93ADD5
MRIMAQMSMVMNLDKCIGCHTCSVTCKQVWTNREGMEYVWFNNVETRPGLGYPKSYEDQDKWKGGWELKKNGKLKLKGGGRAKKLLNIFYNPDMPEIRDYYEPWTYEYDMLLNAPANSQHVPVARPKSLLTGEDMQIQWSANWDDDLGGSHEIAAKDPILAKMNDEVQLEYEKTFMFYLPRICEHCLNPACVAACPSGAMYKRVEDGIVLVDQDKCRGWRMCVSGCPYKKVYFNHKSGKAEKCTMCFPRIEVGLPTVCSETCVGRLRYLGIVLYDADKVTEAASEPDEHKLLDAQRAAFLDPFDPEIIAEAERQGMPYDWIIAAQKSPVWQLISRYEVALPLHPEYRTLPMVWYVPPFTPVVDEVSKTTSDPEDYKILFTALSKMRTPLEYLAELFTAGDTKPVEKSLRRLAAMRSYMRDINLGAEGNEEIAQAVGMTGEDIEDMYRLMALAKYDERYVIPTAHAETARELDQIALQAGCSLEDSVGMTGPGFGADGAGLGMNGGQMMTVSPQQRKTDPTTPSTPGRTNLFGWSPNQGMGGLFPPANPAGA